MVRSECYAEAYYFFDKYCGHVEILWYLKQGQQQGGGGSARQQRRQQQQGLAEGGNAACSAILVPFWFPIPPVCYNLTASSKHDLVWSVDRSSASARQADFMRRAG